MERRVKHFAKDWKRAKQPLGLTSGALYRAVARVVRMTENPIEANGRVEQLTESQKKCLRLVLAHMTSKQIARELGLSPHTVDAHLKASLKALGVAGRTEAALILAQAERGEPYQSLAYQPLGMAEFIQPMVFAPHRNAGATSRAGDVDYTKLVQTDDEHNRNIVQDAFTGSEDVLSIDRINQNRRLGVKDKTWNRENDMSILARLMWIFIISVSSMMIFTLAILTLQSLSSFYD